MFKKSFLRFQTNSNAVEVAHKWPLIGTSLARNKSRTIFPNAIPHSGAHTQTAWGDS